MGVCQAGTITNIVHSNIPDIFIHVVRGSSENTLVQLFRYFWVGGIAFAVDYASLFFLTEFAGLNHLWSAAIAFLLGLVVNYLLSTAWVFKRHSSANRWIEFIVFGIIGVVGLVLNELIIYVGTDIMNFHYMLSKLCSTAIVFFWNFFARKFFLFTNKHNIK